MEETVVTCKDVIKEMPNGERPFESWRLRWVICTTHDAGKIISGLQWRIAANDKQKLRYIFLPVSCDERKNQIRRSYCNKLLKEKNTKKKKKIKTLKLKIIYFWSSKLIC